MTTVFDPEVGVREVQREYLGCAETAKLIRGALRREFPGVKFSVRSSVYSGGASIHIEYTDGPPVREVEAITSGYAGAGFDGMIDLKTYNETWLMPDGTVSRCRSEIGHSYASDRQTPQPAPSSAARLVHFGTDFVFVGRTLSCHVQEIVLAGLIDANPQLAGADLDAHGVRYRDVWIPAVPVDEESGRCGHIMDDHSAAQLVRTAAWDVAFT